MLIISNVKKSSKYYLKKKIVFFGQQTLLCEKNLYKCCMYYVFIQWKLAIPIECIPFVKSHSILVNGL